jgi:hypothetical protein
MDGTMAPVAPPALHDTPRREVEDAVIKEARRRARRRRIRQGLVVAVIVAAVVAALGSRKSPPPHGVDSPASTQDGGFGLTDVSDPAQLLAKYGRVHVGWVLVYVDGRVLWYPDHDPVSERRLTPAGVDLVRVGSLGLDDLLGAKNSTSPADIWSEREAHEYRPTAYAVCLWAAPNHPGEVRAMPAPARDVLSDAPPARAGHVVAASYEASTWHCLRIGRADLAALERSAARVKPTSHGDEMVFARSADGSRVTAFVVPMMPHGEWIAWGG